MAFLIDGPLADNQVVIEVPDDGDLPPRWDFPTGEIVRSQVDETAAPIVELPTVPYELVGWDPVHNAFAYRFHRS